MFVIEFYYISRFLRTNEPYEFRYVDFAFTTADPLGLHKQNRGRYLGQREQILTLARNQL